MASRHAPSSGLRRAKAAKNRYAAELRTLPNVTGVGVGFKIVGGEPTDAVAVRVYVRRKVAPDQLAHQDMVPSAVDGVPTDVIERTFRLEQDPRAGEHQGTFNPIVGGVSVGNGVIGFTGTFTTPVFDGESAQQMLLSNKHVFCGNERSCIGEAITQPGLVDDIDARTVARVHRWSYRRPGQPTDRREVDACLGHLTGERFVDRSIYRIGRAIDAVSPVLGMRVRKSGRTTGVTAGRIADVSSDLDVHDEYEDRDYHFEDQIVIEDGQGLSGSGDSGSLWVDDQTRAVGLHFAGSDDSSVANPMVWVLSAINVSLYRGVTLHDFVAINWIVLA